MNRNIEEQFRHEATALKVPKEMIEEALGLMEKGLPFIKVTGQLPALKGTKDLTIHIKQGGKYNYYFFNRYDLSLSKVKPLEEGKNYMVISTGEGGKKQFKNFKSSIDAIENFKKREGDAELAIGKSIKDYMPVATMKDGKVDYVTKDFQEVYYSPPLTNTVYVNGGVGYNVIQAGNMLEGGSAYRDDLVSRLGNRYQAWNTYQFNEARDKYGNLKIKQYGEGYPFNLQKNLENYRIKELDKPEKLNEIMADMKDGNRPVVTVTNGKDEAVTLRIQAIPRYCNLNFFQLNGKAENREQFQNSVRQGKDLSPGKEKDKSKNNQIAI
ncbi:hypothetical protein [Pedobacter gandavensis]|uniref:hypothetical protein n=1 Tax=Pedobacter gandavensis TaxID=2679963 RepID=UPI00292E238D|nr:hypothetical protein [Pedobacter gandavensis]